MAVADIPEEETYSALGDLGSKSTAELREMIPQLGLKIGIPARRSELVMALLQHHAEENNLLLGAGVLELTNEGYGFLRSPNSKNGPEIYVSQSQVRRFGLRSGDMVAGQIRAPKDGERFYGLVRVEIVNGYDPETSRKRPQFEKLTPLFPEKQIKLSTTPKVTSTRLIDMVAPVGKGQRALIVSPPKAGKTIILKQIAAGITANHPEIYLIVALIGERPEEVTDMRRSVDGEVYSSTFDEPVEEHCREAERALERAKRLVESGEDVVILMDSLTRLARAYNLAVPSSGRTLSGGMDPIALYPPKNFFGAARNCEEGGSLTIVATCLVDTGSRLDDLIYEEFKGTGNMEVHLDRKLAERRVFPSIDVLRSGTRREELLFDDAMLKQVWLLRRMVSIISQDSASTEATERVLERLVKTQDNAEFLASINKPGGP
ncbi:MAG: transcription termination factor Rho [SAR202 cluster bacterium]|nr:transcription termination factor Rho [SAR202 cluster bacterium]